MTLVFQQKMQQFCERPGALSLALAYLLCVVGAVALSFGMSRQVELASAPQPPPNKSFAAASSDANTDSKSIINGPTLPYSQPLSISIPAINLESDLINVGKQQNGAMEVPAGVNYNKAAWYKHSSAPGQYGASVIVGHVDSRDGVSVFFELGSLQPGDEISVDRADGTTAIFTVTDIRQFEKDQFPTKEVYGPIADASELRLVTCSGEFNYDSREYSDNTVVFAQLKSTRTGAT